MSEQKYYVFQKSVNCKKIVSQLVRCKFMGRDGKFVPLSNSKSGRYENSFSEFTKKELAEMMDGALYKGHEMNQDCVFLGCEEWINPLIELVPVEGNE